MFIFETLKVASRGVYLGPPWQGEDEGQDEGPPRQGQDEGRPSPMYTFLTA